MRKHKRTMVLGIVIALLLLVGTFLLFYYNVIEWNNYDADDFGIECVYSTVDYNNNGTDDYTDFLLGARADAENHPRYDGSYYEGGYPPKDIGVCTDVVWRAFANAGYCLRKMVHKDVTERLDAYAHIEKPDNNIDFRRVVNLRVFFERYAISLTLDTEKIAEWQAGDIVIFGEDKHIGIVSDKRNKDGEVYIIHNSGQPRREEDFLKRATVTGHYRFDASLVPEELLVPWREDGEN